MAFAQILGPDGLIIIVVLAVVLLFGGSKLPKLARSLGGASHEFKSASEEYRRASELGQQEGGVTHVVVTPNGEQPTHVVIPSGDSSTATH